MAKLDKIEAIMLREVFNDYIRRREKTLKNKTLKPITRQIIQGEIDNISKLKNKIFGLWKRHLSSLWRHL